MAVRPGSMGSRGKGAGRESVKEKVLLSKSRRRQKLNRFLVVVVVAGAALIAASASKTSLSGFGPIARNGGSLRSRVRPNGFGGPRLRFPMHVRAFESLGSSDLPCDERAARAIQFCRRSQKELTEIAETLSRANSTASKIIFDMIERNDAVLRLLKEVEVEVEKTMNCCGKDDKQSPQMQELLEMRAKIQEELFPVAEMIASLQSSAAGQQALSVLEGKKAPKRTTDHWYPLSFASSIKTDQFVSVEAFGRPWVLFRNKTGAIGCVHDQCAHRACPLSLGKMVDGLIECPYHGWKFNSNGNCEIMPSTRMCKGIGVLSLPVIEADGLVWVWGDETSEPRNFELPISGPMVLPNAHEVQTEMVLEVDTDHQDIRKSLHTNPTAMMQDSSELIQNLPISEKLAYHMASWISGIRINEASKLLQEEISSSPGLFVSAHVLQKDQAQPETVARPHGELAVTDVQKTLTNYERGIYEVHAAIPVGEGRTRLLYRMSTHADGLGQVPKGVWHGMATQHLNKFSE